MAYSASNVSTYTAVVVVLMLQLWVMSVAAQGGGQPYAKSPEGNFQYVNVPGVKEHEFGWRRGNHHHYISRYEQAKQHRFRTRVKWGDAKNGYGEHYWEYNHGPQSYEKADHEPQPSYKQETPIYEAPAYDPPAYEPPAYKPPIYQ